VTPARGEALNLSPARTALVLGGIVVISAMLRVHSLGAASLLIDEAASDSAMESQSTRDWTLFAIAAALCVYAHIFAVLVLSAFAVAIIYSKPFHVTGRSILLVALLFEHLVAPMGLFVLLHHSDQLHFLRPTWTDFSGFLHLVTGEGGTFLTVLYLTLCVFAFVPPGGRSEKESWALRTLGLWLVLPPLLTLAATPIKPLFAPYMLVMCVPGLTILAACGITNLLNASRAQRLAGAAACALVIALSVVSMRRPVNYEYVPRADWRSAVAYVLAHQEPGDGVIFYIPNNYCYRYYVRRAEDEHQVTTAPDTLYPPAQWRPLTPEEVNLVTAGSKRVWLVQFLDFVDPERLAMVDSTLDQHFRLIERHVVPGQEPVTLDLYDHP